MNTLKRLPIALLGLALLDGGCRRPAGDPAWTAESSAAYRAAWEKGRTGDDKAADAMLADLARKAPDTRAGRRAGDQRAVDLSSMSSFSSLIQALSRSIAPASAGGDDDSTTDDNPLDEPDQPAVAAPGEPSPGGP